MNLKKLWPALGLVCMSFFTLASAQQYSNTQTNSTSSQSSSQEMSEQETYQRGTYREITPNAGPRVAHGADVFITADFIWWKATQDGLTYAITGVLGNNSGQLVNVPPGITSKGSVKDPDFGWEPGFKVGLGLNLSHDGWDIFAQYTWYQSDQSSSTNSPGITNLIPAAVPTLIALGELHRKADWNLHFNVIDLELGRNFFVSQFLTLRPHAGFKGTWQNQDFDIHNHPENGFVLTNPLNPAQPIQLPAGSNYKSSQDHDLWGLGVRLGLDTAWYFVKDWSIFAKIAWTAMWTHYDVDRKDTLNTGDPNSNITLVDTDLNNYRVRFVGELELGLRWEIWFYDDNYHFAIQAGWEEQVWINYGSFIRVYNDVQSDLSLHGLNLKLRFDF
ncbi:MAG: autotransporter outer membrane beta-barrel domain-containing protein [Simkania sp.]|nr:autotransporter outer membrane beta-barrel domain-containing protein [Simkania sp.]MCB1075102.1 autotransporter outer membrane beta-barrel domain-containing protein [Simkania sp.]MCP5491293.1 autotransporter outer membrane beta-barrel domain-containing protein [Chlamydiales bacterium]